LIVISTACVASLLYGVLMHFLSMNISVYVYVVTSPVHFEHSLVLSWVALTLRSHLTT
jgi:hypothetical protein